MNTEDAIALEFDFFTFFEKTPDLVCIAGKDGFFRNVNPAVIDKLGYTVAELFAQPISSFIHPEDKELTSSRRANLLKGNALLNFQNRYLTKTGKIIWLEWSSIYLPDKELVFAIAKDVTARKQAEKEVEEQYIKFKSLAAHFKTSIEEDRKYLAAELHEEIAQLASAVKADVDWLNTNAPELTASSKSRIEHTMLISDLLVNTIRRISFSISPSMLDDLGLDATLEWYCKEFSTHTRIPCQFESAHDESALSREIKIDFFRICQESLDNVKYHANASKVIVSIEETSDSIILSIVDNGNGFDTNQKKQTPGLLTMRERAASINGHLAVESKPGKGTKVCVTIAK